MRVAKRDRFVDNWTREQLLREVRELRARNVRLERRLAELEERAKQNCLSDAARRDQETKFELG